jgi:outer membrane receptor protein involved in Fe transport
VLRGIAPFVRAAVVCAATLGMAVEARGQLQDAIIQGIVLGPDGRPVGGAEVTLLDPLGDALKSVAASNDGRFRITNVAPGTYSLRADAPPLRALLQSLTIGGALPIHVDLRMSAVVAEQITVRGQGELDAGSTTTRVTLAGDAVRRAPARLRSRGLQDAIASAPGWATEDNGILHVRGVDDGFLYVVDGVPVYERLDGLFGVAPDPAMIDSVNVSTGYIAPEFGLKSGGVIEVRTAGHVVDRWVGAIDAVAASDATRDVSTVAGGPVSRVTTLTLGVAGQISDRFLDPVHPDNLHNKGRTLSGGGHFGWSVSPATTLTTVAGFGRSGFDVPHGEEQEESQQDQRQRLNQHWQTVSAQHSASSSSVWQVAAYHRSSSSTLVGSPRDTPVFTDADRSLRRLGLLASVTLHRGAHLLKIGGEAARLSLQERFAFAVTDAAAADEADLSAATLSYSRDAPFVFEDAARRALVSFYVQDSLRPFDRLSVDLGVRADWTRLLIRASQWSPRIGASYLWPRTNTTVRAAFGRFFQPPQPENLLLASSEEARELSPFADEAAGGGAELHPERQTAVEAGVEQMLGRIARVDVAYWRRRAQNVADPNVFFGTTIIFPNTVASGRASGIDVRFDVPRRNGWSGFLSYTNSIVRQAGPITGGLFLEDDVGEIGSGATFTPDHDQRHVGAMAVTYEHARSGWWSSVTARYESGTPLGVGVSEREELRERPGAELVDFDRGRVRPRRVIDVMGGGRVIRLRRADVSVRLSVLNVTGAEWAYNFGNPFSGTHFGPGRTIHVGLRAAFR